MKEGKLPSPFGMIVLLPLALVLCALAIFQQSNHSQAENNLPKELEPETPPLTFPLAKLGSLPDWEELKKFQHTISRETFLNHLEKIYTKNGSYHRWITLNDDHAQLNFGDEIFTLYFSQRDRQPPGSVYSWKRKSSLRSIPNKPLHGLHIALDPGHIGGAFSEMEERHLVYRDHAPIREGSMTLLTAKHLKPLLENLGATISLVREKEEPVTTARPEDFQQDQPRSFAEKLFYRSSEIRARAKLVNHTIQPDLVICLHYNATGSPDPLPGQDFHLLINGAYHSGELQNLDERFQMLQRLLSRTCEEEIPLAKSVAATFAQQTGLPPYEYPADHPYSVRLAEFLFARNLLANRLYQCPVIFLEPYTMNSSDFITRHKEGDYEGLKMVDGKMRRSVYREYANAVADGVADYYSSK